MLLLAGILIGLVAARWLWKPLAALLRVGVFVVSIGVALRVVTWAVPEVLALNWRGVVGGAVVGLLLSLTIIGGWFYILGWRGRVSATEADDIKRARDKAIKDRQIA